MTNFTGKAMQSNPLSQMWRRAHGRYQRTASGLFFKRSFEIRSEVPLISFTFDDFPRSALFTGGAILKDSGLTGTYYASLGLMGTEAPTGSIFVREDLKPLLEQGHELGSHTFHHSDAWHTNSRAFEKSIVENDRALRELYPDISFRTFSYPVNPPRPLSKHKTARRFLCSRLGGQTFNAGTVDLNALQAYFLERAPDRSSVERLIDENNRACGWLIFATHDVSRTPTRYGCTPDFFQDIVRYAARSDARIMPVVEACERLSIAGPRGQTGAKAD